MKSILTILLVTLSTFVFCQNTDISNEAVSFSVIEDVPVYQGCDESASSEEKRKCMSDKISEHVLNNFDQNIARKLNLPSGTIRISIYFMIDVDGEIINIQAKAAHDALETEAVRVVRLIPKMKPGLMRGKPVVVPYSLPLLFKVEEDSPSKDVATYPVYRGCDKDLEYDALKKCTTEKIMDFVKVNTTIDAAEKLFPTERSTQFKAEFVIDKNGRIKDIKVKAHKREMAALVVYALKQLPKMKHPGTINGKAADVSFGFLMTIYF